MTNPRDHRVSEIRTPLPEVKPDGGNSNEETKKEQQTAALAGLIGIKPQDELGGMIAAQLLACHSASMESYRRAMMRELTFDGSRENLNQANKLSRTYATLLEALNRHRGKGQQQVRVEHVHVHEGGQAIVGNVETKGGGVPNEVTEQPMHLPMHQSRRCLARTRRGSPCKSPAMPNGRCRMHGGTSTGAPKGNKNAFKHGRIRLKPFFGEEKSRFWSGWHGEYASRRK